MPTTTAVRTFDEAVRAAQRSRQLAFVQYQNGVTDFTTVLTAEQQLLQQQDALAVTAGAIPTNLVVLRGRAANAPDPSTAP